MKNKVSEKLVIHTKKVKIIDNRRIASVNFKS